MRADRDIVKSCECVTMGHAHCKKVLRIREGKMKLMHIVHYVYGRRVIENIRREYGNY